MKSVVEYLSVNKHLAILNSMFTYVHHSTRKSSKTNPCSTEIKFTNVSQVATTTTTTTTSKVTL